MDANNIKLGVDTKCSGTVAVANDVVAIIASLAAAEVEGVSSMFGNITNELMSMVGMKNLTKGVRVSVLNHTVTVDLYIVLDYGYPIPDTCRKVQEKVKSAIETMTGLDVADVNIRIASVEFPQSSKSTNTSKRRKRKK